MKKYPVVFLMVLFFLGLIPIGCSDRFGGCGDLKPVKDFYIRDMAAKTVLIKNQNSNIDTSKYYDSDSIATALYITSKQEACIYPQNYSISFTSSAYACSPAQPKAKQRIKSIVLIASAPFNLRGKDYFSGDSITDLFLISQYHSAFLDIDNFLSTQYYIDAYGELWLKLAASPFQNLDLNYTIELTLDDETKFDFVDQRLKIY